MKRIPVLPLLLTLLLALTACGSAGEEPAPAEDPQTAETQTKDQTEPPADPEEDPSLARLRTEIEAIDIARDTMTRLSTTIRDSFGLYLNRHASELIAGITGGIYTSLSIDQDLNVSLNTEKKLVPLEQVSSGTMNQVYLALRLASADLMRQDGVQLPLFLDDSFVNYDEDRLRTVLRWLPETFPDRQILVFSCHRREAQLLSANMIPYTLTEIA